MKTFGLIGNIHRNFSGSTRSFLNLAASYKEPSYTERVIEDGQISLKQAGKEGDYVEFAKYLLDRNMASPEAFLRWNHPYEGTKYNLPGYNPEFKSKIVLPTGNKQEPWKIVPKNEALKQVVVIGGKDTGIHPGLIGGLKKQGVVSENSHVLYIGENAYVQDTYARNLHKDPNYYDPDAEEVAKFIYSRLKVVNRKIEFEHEKDRLYFFTYSAGQKTFIRIMNALANLIETHLRDATDPEALQAFCSKYVRTQGTAIAPCIWKSKQPMIGVNTFSEFCCTDMGTTPLLSMYYGIYFNPSVWNNPYTLFEISDPRFPGVKNFFTVYGKDVVPAVLPDGKPNLLDHNFWGMKIAAEKVLPKELQDFRREYFTLSPKEFEDYGRKLSEKAVLYHPKDPKQYSRQYQSDGYHGLAEILAESLRKQDEARKALKVKAQELRHTTPQVSSPDSRLKEVQVSDKSKEELGGRM